MLMFFRHCARAASAAVIVTLMAAPLAYAGGMAVVDSRKVLQDSSAAKAYAKSSEDGFRERIDQIKALEKEAQQDADKFKRDSLTMSEADKSLFQLKQRHRDETIRALSQLVSRDKASADRAELGRLGPLLDKAIDAVARAGGYDMVVEKEAVRFSKSSVDITAKVTDKLNALAK